MSGRQVASTDLRLRLNRGQWALAAVLLLLIVALVANNYAVTDEQRRYSEAYARTETAGNNMFYTLSETLTYVNEAERYLLGAASRRDVQVKRALLAQRLAVVSENGVTAGESTSPEYRDSLSALDDAIRQVPPGNLPVDQRDRWAMVVLPRAQALWVASRRLADTATAELHTEARTRTEILLRGRLIQLALLIAALVVGAGLLGWVALNVARQYRGARATLDEDRGTLQRTQQQLARVSALEQDQARVLERIATGDALKAVLRQIAELAAEASGARAVRVSTGVQSLVVPPDADLSGEPVWSGDFHVDAGATAGELEVFGASGTLDETARTALERCRDLVSLALVRDAAAAKLSYQASHDALTGLANRSLLLARLSDSLASPRRNRTHLALLLCDLDRFKMVNDSIGHAAGDQLLIEAGRRLSAVVRETDTVARLGGDEFVVLCPDLPDRGQALELAERVRTALDDPYTVEGKEAFVGASIGIAFADESTAAGADLMREADVAMYRAKLTEGSHLNVFDARLEAEVAERLDLDSALRRALERDQMRVTAQPIVLLDTGVVTGFELLLRWRRPGLPHLSPETFIPLAEDNGMIVEIGRWVLATGIANLGRWRASGLAERLTISVNVSARQVREAGFAEEVLELLRAQDVPPESLIVELTEHALVDLQVSRGPLTQLRDAGVRVSLDDFGTGYSSLTQLRTLPVDQIKLDRSFVAALDGGDDKQRAVVKSVVGLARALALDLVVEGVETVAERDLLIGMGAVRCQGFLYDRPLTLDAARQLLEAGGVCTVAEECHDARAGG